MGVEEDEGGVEGCVGLVVVEGFDGVWAGGVDGGCYGGVGDIGGEEATATFEVVGGVYDFLAGPFDSVDFAADERETEGEELEEWETVRRTLFEWHVGISHGYPVTLCVDGGGIGQISVVSRNTLFGIPVSLESGFILLVIVLQSLLDQL